jgi:hypothetical protein
MSCFPWQSFLVWPLCDGPSHRIVEDNEEHLLFEVHPNKCFNWYVAQQRFTAPPESTH